LSNKKDAVVVAPVTGVFTALAMEEAKNQWDTIQEPVITK